MKRNLGSIKASIKRQSPVAAKGELLSRTTALSQKDPAQLIDAGGVMKKGSVSLVVMNQQAAAALAGNGDMEKVAIGAFIRGGARLWGALRGGATATRGAATRIRDASRVRSAARATRRAARETASHTARMERAARPLASGRQILPTSLEGANKLTRQTAHQPTLRQTIQATGRTGSDAGDASLRAAEAQGRMARTGATGATSITRTQAPVTAGALGRQGHRMKETLKGAGGRLFGRGTGMRNVYKNKDGVEFLGSRMGGLANLVPGGRSILKPGNTKRGVELVSRWDQTGGVVPRMLKGMARGGARGGAAGYGLSYAANQDAAWNDPMRMRMMRGGALMGTAWGGGKNWPAFLGGAALEGASHKGWLGEGMQDASTGLGSIQPLFERQQIGRRERYGSSAMKALRGHSRDAYRRDNTQRLRRTATENAAAQANWDRVQAQITSNQNQLGSGSQTRPSR